MLKDLWLRLFYFVCRIIFVISRRIYTNMAPIMMDKENFEQRMIKKRGNKHRQKIYNAEFERMKDDIFEKEIFKVARKIREQRQWRIDLNCTGDIVTCEYCIEGGHKKCQNINWR